jgi:hypothetical protein
MPSYTNDPVVSKTTKPHPGFSGGVYGESSEFNGVRGVSSAAFHGAVAGIQENPTDQAGPGVFGQSKGTGVWGESQTWMGVYGKSSSTTGGAGVMGEAVGAGVLGKSSTWHGVYGETVSTTPGASGVMGEAHGPGSGLVGKSEGGEGMHAETQSVGAPAVAAYNLNPRGTGAAVYAKKEGSVGHAGFFDGDVHVTRTISVEGDVMLLNADCAEEFVVEDPAVVSPGAVMVIGEAGAAAPCRDPYDRRVLGVVSGAGGLRPGLILDGQGGVDRRPITLVGKVYCLVDAAYGAIAPGDLLTTSSTSGHAMRASDLRHASGALLGKALQGLGQGRGVIPILAMLQ